MFSSVVPDDSIIGSPLKKQRGSIYDTEEEAMKKLVNNIGYPAPMGDVLGLAEASLEAQDAAVPKPKTEMDEEEL
jgi:hypothetical protein